MKSRILMFVPILLVFGIIFMGCGSSITYQDIFDEYSSKIKEAAPTLVEEFNTEAAALNGDVTKLAELSNKKISSLAEISTEGTKKMAELQLKNGDEYSTYEEWAVKLTSVYEEEAKKITDAYMALAAG